MLKTYVIELNDNLSDEHLNFLRKLSSSDRKRKSDKYHHRDDRKRCLLGGILLSEILLKDTGLHKENQKIKSSVTGKPYLLRKDDVFFSISHSGKYVACSVSDKEVGLDIEQYAENAGKEMMELVLSDEELIEVYATEDPAGTFTRFWTLKESYIKKTGRGLSENIKELSFLISEDMVTARDGNKKMLKEKFTVKNIGNYFLSVCSHYPAESFTFLTENELLRNIC